MTGDAVVQEVGGRPTISWWQVLRVALVVGWVAWACLTWWSAPREATVEQARADIAAGRLTYYEWGNGWEHDSGPVSAFPSGLEQQDGPGPMLLWRTTDGRRHYTTVDNDSVDGEPPAEDGTLYSRPEATRLDQELQAYEPRRPADPPVETVQVGLLIAGTLLVLWALVSAPDPVTGTKWFWFWLVSGVPLGLGMLWWLARERPWRPRAEPRFGPPGRENRLRWWAGIGIGILAGFAVSLAVLGLRGLLGADLVPVVR
ncbi:hypothetical protein GCM10020358_51240 [Amorphoplanes nipponensis]|uniref:Uncharacterized protein n=1 Tax=Actinoplanes nipponensis TaxID=135950 RepID=A0A919JK21_9ACTN|nr:hypothetical protein [Actinoplanes nipponensis]GIE50882.1 hypothetical protein Ani05nite_44160 [Actinoplanes nipponensis]